MPLISHRQTPISLQLAECQNSDRGALAYGLNLSAYYTWSKSLDQVSNGDAADANANQTNPANNATEWGPADYDVRHRLTATGVYEIPHVHSGSDIVKAVANGWQVNGVMTWHTAFPWTPVTWNLQANELITGANLVGPTRPLAYYGGAGTGCSNSAWKTGSNFPKGGPAYFNTTPPTSVNAPLYVPGIGRNSFRGPCYFDTDMSFAKETTFDHFDRHMLLRLQAKCLQHLQHSSTGADFIQQRRFQHSERHLRRIAEWRCGPRA